MRYTILHKNPRHNVACTDDRASKQQIIDRSNRTYNVSPIQHREQWEKPCGVEFEDGDRHTYTGE